MNRLDHGISYSKVLEIRTTIANSKLSSSTTLIPNYIHQHIPTTAVYDNIDRLEETLSKSDTTHQVNGVLVHQAFIGPSLPPEKKNRIAVPQHVLPIYNGGRIPEFHVLSCLDQKLWTESI